MVKGNSIKVNYKNNAIKLKSACIKLENVQRRYMAS